MIEIPINLFVVLLIAVVSLFVIAVVHVRLYDKWVKKAETERVNREALKVEYNKRANAVDAIQKLAPNFFELFSYEKLSYPTNYAYGVHLGSVRTHRVWDFDKLTRIGAQVKSQTTDDTATLALLNEGNF